MLKQRIITALVLIPMVMGAIFFLPSNYFSIFMGFVVVAAAWEWTALIGQESLSFRIPYLLIFVFAMYSIDASQPSWIWLLAALWWGLALAWVIDYPNSSSHWAGNSLLLAAVGVILLIPAWHGLVFLHGQPQGSGWVLYVMVIVWSADSGAYFVGRRYGANKLAPNVSPGKSIEGLLGGAAATLLVGLGVAYFVADSFYNGVALVCLTVLVSFISVLGDLVESMVKRARGVKDSGNILPGHGGILDRIDSLTAASPIYALGWYLSQ